MSETPVLDSQAFLADLLGCTVAQIMSHQETVLSNEQEQRFQFKLERLSAGEPLPYVVEHQDFFGLEFYVNPAVLIPRPETELIVEKALIWLRDHPEKRLVADAGTGSGCIAISL